MSDVDPVVARIAAEGLIAPGRAVLVLLSGGRDSSCLLHAAATIAGAPAVRALHVNYGLRDAAAADEQACRAMCEELGVPLEVYAAAAFPGAGNLQAWAREVRYAAASESAAQTGAEIATGHTVDDQVETILYRLISSPSRRAILGMSARGGTVIRPLLAVTRAQTTAYCERHGIAYRDDASNATSAYTRNRIRHELLPLARELHPGVEANLLALADQLRQEGAVLDGLVDDILGGGETVSLERLRQLPPALAALVLQRLADGAAGAPAPGTARRAADVLALGDHAALDLPHGVRALVRRGIVAFVRTPLPG